MKNYKKWTVIGFLISPTSNPQIGYDLCNVMQPKCPDQLQYWNQIAPHLARATSTDRWTFSFWYSLSAWLLRGVRVLVYSVCLWTSYCFDDSEWVIGQWPDEIRPIDAMNRHHFGPEHDSLVVSALEVPPPFDDAVMAVAPRRPQLQNKADYCFFNSFTQSE